MAKPSKSFLIVWFIITTLLVANQVMIHLRLQQHETAFEITWDRQVIHTKWLQTNTNMLLRLGADRNWYEENGVWKERE